ncbi:MAG TPA: polysaccharide biosynthesis tyrosine autokinase, partial [Vicinamibacteria bacterium]
MTRLTPPEAAPALHPLERDVDARYYADLLWRSRLLLLAAGVGGLALGLLVAEVQTKHYRARTLLEVMPPNPTSLTVTDALVGTGNPVRDRQYFNTQLNVLHSRALGERVVKKLKLDDRPPFKDHRDAAGLFMSKVQVEAVPETFVVEVRVTDPDPQQAALWANTLGDLYIDYSIEGQVESARRAYRWVTERLAETQTSMQDAQNKLLKSYQGQDLFVPEGSVSAITTSITKLNDDFVQTQARKITLQSQLVEFSGSRQRGRELDAVPQVAGDGTVLDLNAKLQGLNLELLRLKEKFKEAHPEVQKVQVQIDLLKKARTARIQQIEDGLRAEYRQLERREAELKDAIDVQKGQAVAQSQRLTELDSLKKQADSATGLYTVLLQKLNETNIAASLQNNNVRLLDRAIVPTTPVWPERNKLAMVGLLLGLLLGAGYLLLRDYFGNTIKDAEDIERYLRLELLAAVPRHTKENAPLATEAYQTLRTALLFARRDERGQVLLVSGTAPGEGKTTTVVNLAQLLAVSGERVLVVDCDLRRANLHNRLGVAREPGLTDFFVKQMELHDLIQPTQVKNLFVLTAGPLPPYPPALLARDDVHAFVEQLRHHYRWVILDSPPLASVTDALLLARHADHSVLVVQHDKVDKKVVKRSLMALRRATDHVLGAVLNAVDVKTGGHYYYYHQDEHGAAG